MNNNFKISILFVAILCLLTTSIFAQFTRNDAIDTVLNTILVNDVDDVDVYASDNSVAVNVKLIDSDSIINPYASSWVFFVDDNPFASWYHASRIICVSTANGAYSISNVKIYIEG